MSNNELPPKVEYNDYVTESDIKDLKELRELQEIYDDISFNEIYRKFTAWQSEKVTSRYSSIQEICKTSDHFVNDLLNSRNQNKSLVSMISRDWAKGIRREKKMDHEFDKHVFSDVDDKANSETHRIEKSFRDLTEFLDRQD